MPLQCPACHGAVEKALLHEGHPWLHPCPACGFAFTYPPPVFAETAPVYEDAYTADPKAEAKTRRLARDYLRKVRPFLPATGSFLEIGGSHGWFAEAVAKTTRLEVTLLEPGRTAVEAAKKRGLNAVRGFLEDFKPGRRYDAVFAGHVAEHVPDLDAFLCQCRELLEPGGRLLLLTPNARAWKFRLLGAAWGWAAPGSHLQFLSAESARLLLERNGFALDAIQFTRPGFAHYPVFLTGLLSRLYTHFFGRAEKTAQPPAPGPPASAAQTAPAKQGGLNGLNGLKRRLAANGRKAGRPVLWAEYAWLCTLDLLMGRGRRDELLIAATRRS